MIVDGARKKAGEPQSSLRDLIYGRIFSMALALSKSGPPLSGYFKQAVPLVRGSKPYGNVTTATEYPANVRVSPFILAVAGGWNPVV